MSFALVILLNKQISEDIMKQYNMFEIITYFDNNNLIIHDETTMYISDASEILKGNSDQGYDLRGYAYALFNGSGFHLYTDFNIHSLSMPDFQMDKIINYKTAQNKWVFNIIKELLDAGYSVKMFNGFFESEDIPEKFLRVVDLSVESLKDIYTTIEDNVLYDIYNEKD